MDTQSSSPNHHSPAARRQLYMDDSPIKPAIDGHRIRTFEEFLNQSLQNIDPDEYESRDQENTVPVKRPFLKKGTGLMRYKLPAGSPRQTRLCESNARFKRSTISSSLASSEIHVLPRTSTSRPAPPARAAISRREPLRPGQRSKLPVAKERLEPEVQSSSSLENLEGLLQTVRHRKEEVLRRLEASDSSSSDWEEDSDEEDLEQEVLLDFKDSKVSKPRKKVRWTKKTKGLPVRSSVKLNKPCQGPYSLHLAHSINQLEEKLRYLQQRCDPTLSPKKQHQRSDVLDETIALKKEVLDLNQKLANLTQELKTLQVMTGKAASAANIKNIEKRTKVTVHKVPVLNRPATITRNISLPRSEPNDSIVHFENGCTMQRLRDNTVIHTFKNGTKQTTFPDNSKLVEFTNGQIERTLANGVKHVTYPNRNHRIIYPDGSEELTTADGTILRIGADGTEVVIMPNGEREIRSTEYTRHEYRNGIIKTVYADGTQETRYPSGRLRIKDKHENVIVDSMVRTTDQLGLVS